MRQAVKDLFAAHNLPCVSEGDVLGCVTFLSTPGDQPTGESEYKLAQAIAGFLGRHMES